MKPPTPPQPPQPPLLSQAQVVDVILRQMISESGAELSPATMTLAHDLVGGAAVAIALSGVPYIIAEHGTALLCLRCGNLSHNPHDVEHKYCGACHEFLNDVING